MWSFHGKISKRSQREGFIDIPWEEVGGEEDSGSATAGLFNRPVLQPNDLEILEAEELVGAARSSTSTTTPKTNMFVATGNFLGLS